MRGFFKFPEFPDLISFLAVAGLLTAVYLASLPQSYHSLSHRKAAEVDMLAEAQDRIDKEGALFIAMVAAHDLDSRDILRQAVVDNDRQFLELCQAMLANLPEARNEFVALRGQYIQMSSAGWRAEAAAHDGGANSQAQSAMQEQFIPALAAVRSEVQNLQHRLRTSSTALDMPGPHGVIYRALSGLI
jgi:hypothetical protein